tara:strand:+ start:1190 stop:1525 length:336 start_codon:yes stop_codon:yes gene_type:complete
MKYKYEEIKEYFKDFIKENEKQIKEDNNFYEELHHECFNTDYYIIGTYKATQWLGEEVFNVIEYIKEYENNNFGEVTTDFSDPEKIVNMYVYIIGEKIVYNYKEELEKETV